MYSKDNLSQRVNGTKRRRLNDNTYVICEDKPKDEIYINVIRNHIYFYSDVTNKSCFELTTHLRILDIALDGEDYKDFKKKDKVIHLHINSYGGCLMSAITIINTISALNHQVYSYIDGYAASAGTLISCVCKKRFMYKNSRMLIHQLSSIAEGTYENIIDEFNDLTELMEEIRKIYMDNTKIKEKELRELLSRDIWLNSKKCLQYKLVDKIL